MFYLMSHEIKRLYNSLLIFQNGEVKVNRKDKTKTNKKSSYDEEDKKKFYGGFIKVRFLYSQNNPNYHHSHKNLVFKFI